MIRLYKEYEGKLPISILNEIKEFFPKSAGDAKLEKTLEKTYGTINSIF